MTFSYEDHLVLRVAIGAEKTTVAVEKSYMTYVRASRKDDDVPLEELISSKGLILSKGEEEALDGFLKEAYEYAYKDKIRQYDEDSLFSEEVCDDVEQAAF